MLAALFSNKTYLIVWEKIATFFKRCVSIIESDLLKAGLYFSIQPDNLSYFANSYSYNYKPSPRILCQQPTKEMELSF